VAELVQEHPYLKARIEPVDDKTPVDEVEIEALGIDLKKLAREVIEMMPELPAAATELVEAISQPGQLADLTAGIVAVPNEEEQDELGDRLKKIGLPPEVEKVAHKELNRLKSIPTASSEYTVARTYLEWIADLPWSQKTEDNLDVENAKGVLQNDHYSLEKV